ncbi:hypothetical protein HD806DRAFT_508074 [Xylariaceae sp. AK1471]|nr:hypothetical protein HD806DRAFT_508074 [Xylariaceae sp. AK1471]
MGEVKTKKYVVAPNGHVIIHLRNFDPPFAVLPKDEELYVHTKGLFGSTKAFDSASAFGSAGGLFGSKPPSDSASAFGSGGGLFGSKNPSGPPNPFGSAAPSGSTSGFGSTGLFGSTAPSGSTSASEFTGLFNSIVFGSRAPSDSTSAFGSTGLFGSKPSSGSPGFAGFGSTTPSGSTSTFGSAAPSGSSPLFGSKSPSGSTSAFGSMAASGSTSLFGSAPPSGSTAPLDSTAPSSSTASSNSTRAASSADNIKQQRQPHSDDVKHEPTRVAPQVPGEKAVKPQEQTEPSVSSPEIQLQVSSAHLKLASRHFQKVFDSKFKKSQRDSDGLLHVDASGWDTEALLIVLRVIHGQHRKLPKTMDLELLAKIAVIVDSYDCHEIFDAFAELWLQRLKSRFILLHKLDRELLLLLFVSWVFGWTNEFKLATRIVLHQSKGPLRTLDLPIPEKITNALASQREEALRKIGLTLNTLVSGFQSEPPTCSFECASMNLGALSRQIYQKNELRGLGNFFISLDGQSVASAMAAVHTIRSPNWTCSNGLEGPFCNLGLLVRSEIDKLENLEGLNLEDFIKPV